MKPFKSLLVAPATLGLLAPMTANATEVNFNAISNYSDEEIEIDINSFKPKSNQNLLLSGGEGLVDSHSHDGGFSDTTVASFSVDTVIGAIDGASSEATSLDFQFNIGLSTSFTGEDSLDIAIDNGSDSPSIEPITVSTLNDAEVVSENPPASKLLNLASNPSTRLLVTASSSAGLNSLMF